MGKQIITILLCLLIRRCISQDCSPGYEYVLTKCKGQLVYNCIPAGYTCNQCWDIMCPNCSGSYQDAYQPFWYAGKKTYSEALAFAQDMVIKESKRSTPCQMYNCTQYKIYLNGCGDMVQSDIQAMAKGTAKRIAAQIANYRNMLNSRPHISRAVLEEYQTTLNQVQNNVHTLEGMINNIKNYTAEQIEQANQYMEKDEIKLKDLFSKLPPDKKETEQNPQQNKNTAPGSLAKSNTPTTTPVKKSFQITDGSELNASDEVWEVYHLYKRISTSGNCSLWSLQITAYNQSGNPQKFCGEVLQGSYNDDACGGTPRTYSISTQTVLPYQSVKIHVIPDLMIEYTAQPGFPGIKSFNDCF